MHEVYGIPVTSVPSGAFARASLIYLLRQYLMGYWLTYHQIQKIETRKPVYSNVNVIRIIKM